MKEINKVLCSIEDWAKADKKNRLAFVVMTDLTSGDAVSFFDGESNLFAELLDSAMENDIALGKIIYISACVFAKKHIDAIERIRINEMASEFVKFSSGS